MAYKTALPHNPTHPHHHSHLHLVPCHLNTLLFIKRLEDGFERTATKDSVKLCVCADVMMAPAPFVRPSNTESTTLHVLQITTNYTNQHTTAAATQKSTSSVPSSGSNHKPSPQHVVSRPNTDQTQAYPSIAAPWISFYDLLLLHVFVWRVWCTVVRDCCLFRGHAALVLCICTTKRLENVGCYYHDTYMLLLSPKLARAGRKSTGWDSTNKGSLLRGLALV